MTSHRSTPNIATQSIALLGNRQTRVAGGSHLRILNILSGLAVLFTTLAFAHLLHHYYAYAGDAAHSPPFLAGIAFGILIGIFSLIGGCLLLKRGR